jgi:4-diphosphocytidyl-2-C-methyl-D-erythritol kinase
MQALYDVAAPAKLNLFLHITGRRPDGYHLLQSAFMLIDWCDTLHFELRTDGQLSREDLSTPLPPDDLVLRAARALQTATGTCMGAHIGVYKEIPAQAGMGGGSSDAASCLLALNRLWKLGLTTSQLQTIALPLGADVPFFVGGRNAWVEGIGEKITPLSIPPSRFLVAKPPEGLDTKLIFSSSDLKRNSDHAILAGFAARPLHFGENVLQPVAENLCPAIKEVTNWLKSKGLNARMTGSGSAVFAHMPSDTDVTDAPSAWSVRKCSNMDVHPMVDWASSDG